MKSGLLNRKVKIQENIKEFDAYGEPLPACWRTVVETWANIKHASGLQTIKQGLDLSVNKVSIRIRYRENIHADMRVVYKNQIYDIRAILPDIEHRDFLDLVCEIGQNNG